MKVILASSDAALARRIEAGHAHSGVTFVEEARDGNEAAEELCGGWAVFQGTGLPTTQALAIGMNGPVSEQEMDRLEEFFHTRGSPAVIDLCTLADASLHRMIGERGYVVREVTNVLARVLEPGETFASGGHVLAVEAGEMQEWSRLIVRGFEAPEEYASTLEKSPPGVHSYFCVCEGTRAGGAATELHGGLATLFGDSTLVEWRGRGLQLASIVERLKVAAERGCDLASASVLPGSVSHRNYERAGFQMLYARVMVVRAVARAEVQRHRL